MAVTEADTREPVTIALADVGAPVPETSTVDVMVTATGLTVARNGETFVIEHDGDGWALTGVVGRDELPERVPDWLESIAELCGCEEVRLGR